MQFSHRILKPVYGLMKIEFVGVLELWSVTNVIYPACKPIVAFKNFKILFEKIIWKLL